MSQPFKYLAIRTSEMLKKKLLITLYNALSTTHSHQIAIK